MPSNQSVYLTSQYIESQVVVDEVCHYSISGKFHFIEDCDAGRDVTVLVRDR